MHTSDYFAASSSNRAMAASAVARLCRRSSPADEAGLQVGDIVVQVTSHWLLCCLSCLTLLMPLRGRASRSQLAHFSKATWTQLAAVPKWVWANGSRPITVRQPIRPLSCCCLRFGFVRQRLVLFAWTLRRRSCCAPLRPRSALYAHSALAFATLLLIQLGFLALRPGARQALVLAALARDPPGLLERRRRHRKLVTLPMSFA